MGATRDEVSTTGDTHRTVSMWSCGIGLSHHALMLILASRTIRAPNTTENVGTRSYERAPRSTKRGLNHFPRRVMIARRVLGVSEPLVARGPRLPLTRTCVLPRACVCALSGRHRQGCKSSGTPGAGEQPQTRTARSSLTFLHAYTLHVIGVDMGPLKRKPNSKKGERERG